MNSPRMRKFQQWIAYHALIIASAMPTAWIMIPQDLRESLPQYSLQIMAGIIGFCGIIGKVCQVAADNRTSANCVPCEQEKSGK